jgi:hypothetical protein
MIGHLSSKHKRPINANKENMSMGILQHKPSCQSCGKTPNKWGGFLCVKRSYCPEKCIVAFDLFCSDCTRPDIGDWKPWISFSSIRENPTSLDSIVELEQKNGFEFAPSVLREIEEARAFAGGANYER